jgi:hypothetical protein
VGYFARLFQMFVIPSEHLGRDSRRKAERGIRFFARDATASSLPKHIASRYAPTDQQARI